MMKNRRVIGAVVIGLIMTSCGFKSDFSKRKYLNLKSKNNIEIVVEENQNSGIQENLSNSIVQMSDQEYHADIEEGDTNLEMNSGDTDSVVVHIRFEKTQPDSVVVNSLENTNQKEDEISKNGDKTPTKVKNENRGNNTLPFHSMHPLLKLLLCILAIPVLLVLAFLFVGFLLWITGSGF